MWTATQQRYLDVPRGQDGHEHSGIVGSLRDLWSLSPTHQCHHVLIMSDRWWLSFASTGREEWDLDPRAEAVSLWNWCISNWITLSPVYFPGNQNVLADSSLSRHFAINHKWELLDSVLSSIFALCGTLTRELFTSQKNRKYNIYCFKGALVLHS